MKKKLAKKTAIKQPRKVTKNVPHGTSEKKADNMNKKNDPSYFEVALQSRKSGECMISADTIPPLVKLYVGLKPGAKRDARIVLRYPATGKVERLGSIVGTRVFVALCEALLPVGDDPTECSFANGIGPRLEVIEAAMRLTRKAIK